MALTPKEAANLQAQDVEIDDDIVGDDNGNDIIDPNVEVKGPDPDIWGPDEERPAAEPDLSTESVDSQGAPIEVKGPDPAVWGSEEV